MKRSFSRLLSMILILAMVLGFFPGAAPRVKAWTVNQQRIKDRCDYFYNTTWVAQKTIYGWRDNYIFYEGETYRLPYAQPVNSGAFIGYGVTLEEFERVAADPNSVYYSRQSEFNGWTSTYYGTDCAAFVAMCWGVVRQDCTTLWYSFTNLGAVTLSNVLNTLELGDALDSTSVGHVVLVSDLIYDSYGNLTTIEITEQTPPQLKRSYYTPEELVDKYGDAYYIFRHYGSVPEAPVRGYESECTAYDAHCAITVTANTPIMSLPCSEDVKEESENLGEVLAGETYTAIKLYENTEGELWYQIKAEGNDDAFIRAESVRYEKDILTDIRFEDGQAPSAHVRGTTFAVNGNISAQYNRITTVVTYIYEGFGRDSSPVTGDSDGITGNAYTLKNSYIDYNTSFGTLGTGKHTYYIAVEYINYYVDGDGVIRSNSGSIDLMEEYFMVVSSSVNQNTCSHNYEQTIISVATCTQPGTAVYSCNSCGKVYREVSTASGHAYGNWELISDADCVSSGLRSRNCSDCGYAEEEVIPATGHYYEDSTIPGDCQTYPSVRHTCQNCGDVYDDYAEEMYSDWLEEVPAEVPEELIQSKTQYRYRDRIIVTSERAVLEGYELLGSDWAKKGESATVAYVKAWPSGFDTTHELYGSYENTPVNAEITDTAKTVINSDEVTGYLYYHWCYENSYYTAAQKSGSYDIFHAFYSTVDPDTHTRYDPNDNSYYFTNECCGNSGWFFVTEVNTQTFTTYAMEYTHGKWGEFSDWSDVQPERNEDRMVQERTMFRFVDGELGEHNWEDGVCTVCGTATQEPTDPVEPVQTVLTGRNFSLSFEDEILVNFYFAAEHAEDAQIGMLVFHTDPGAADFAMADEIYDAALNETSNLYCATTDGIAAKQMGDTRYYAAYAKASDGTYTYSALYEYSPKKYALSRLENSNDAEIKALCVAMLNYGAAAQRYFGYRTEDLMNAALTEQQQALVVGYDPELFAGAVPVDASKIGPFGRTDVGFGARSATVSFDGAFAINYYFQPDAPIDGEITFYYWNAADYAAASVLSTTNATGKLTMIKNGDGSYYARVTGIAAKQMDDTYYVAAFYTSDFTVCCTGVISYSLSRYCMNNAVDGNEMQELAAQTAVYGYHAKCYFS